MKGIIGFAAALLVIGAAAAGWLSNDGDTPITLPVPIPGDSPFRYPIQLWDRRAEGETMLMVHVTDAGAVDTAYVLVPSGEPAFDSAALAGARELRFDAARRGDDRIAMWVGVPVRFRMPVDSIGGPGTR